MIKKLLFFSFSITTFFISILYVIWFSKTVDMYTKFQFHLNFATPENKLYNTGIINFYNIFENIDFYKNKKRSDLTILIKEGSISTLNKNLPLSGKKEQKAFFYVNDEKKFYKTKVRYRGDNSYHWLFDDKSWRIKTSKKDLYNGIRKFNLINPKGKELLNNHISYKLANVLGLLSPESEMMTLKINEGKSSVKLNVQQIDESFLRQNYRMPNDVYKGDSMGTSYYDGIPRNVALGSYLWEKSSYNNHYDKNNKIPLKTFLNDIENNRIDITDKESFAKFFVFYSLLNSFHIDNAHNWLLSYDHYYEKMIPVIWDPLGYWKDWETGEFLFNITSDITEVFHHDYDLIREEFIAFRKFFLEDENNFLTLVNQEINNIKIKIQGTKYNIAANQKVLQESETILELEKLSLRIKKRIDFLKKELYTIDLSNYNWNFEDDFTISIGGTIPVSKINIILKKPLLKLNDKVYIKYFLNNKIVLMDITKKVSLKNNLITIDSTFLANITVDSIKGKKKFGIEVKDLSFEKATYQFLFSNNLKDNIQTVKFELFDLNNTIVEIDYVKGMPIRSFKNVRNIIDNDKDNIATTWKNVKKLKDFSIIEDDLLIKPGTKIIFDENATLKVFGKVTAIGTKENPIVFEAKDPAKPWNAFALKDERANGSVFKHCIFKDGSGDKGDLHEYTAMFSVHNVKDLLVEDCEFYDSKRTDDMVHVIYSDATFKNTKFVRSLSDALDVDISNLVVDNCEFIDSGNDSIDLMTTNAIVTNTKFTNSKDKGISIGEGSNLLAVNNFIQGSEIGMQSKDTSQAYIYNTSFIANKKAVDAYHKNWRYSEGGTIILDQCIFEKNIINATVGKKSKVVINSSSIDTPNKFDTKSLRKKKIIISDDSSIKYDLKESLFKDKTHLISKDGRGYHE